MSEHMTARPMTEGEREEALKRAEVLADIDRRWQSGNMTGNQFYLAMQSHLDANVVLTLARALLSSSSAVRGMREALEMADEHIGALLRIYEDAAINSDADRARVKEIAAAFGERCLAAALSVEEGKEQARPSGSAPISTDTKGTTK